MVKQRDDFPTFLQTLKPLVEKRIGKQPDFQTKWDSVTSQFLIWLNGLSAGTSALTRNLLFLEKLSITYKLDLLRSDIATKDLVLSDAAAVGQIVTKYTPEGKPMDYKIVDRSITPDYGIQFALQSENGDILIDVFYD